MLFDFEPSTASTPTKHSMATARELHTPVRLITFSMVNMETTLFAHPKTLRPLLNNNKNRPPIWDKVAYLTQTS